jgi:hypothetical protein
LVRNWGIRFFTILRGLSAIAMLVIAALLFLTLLGVDVGLLSRKQG